MQIKLIDVCLPFRLAMDEFQAYIDFNDLEAAHDAWWRAVDAAAEYRASLIDG